MIYQHNKHNRETTLQTGAVLCGINIFSYRDQHHSTATRINHNQVPNAVLVGTI